MSPDNPVTDCLREKKEVNLYEEDDLDETGHKKENPLMKLLHADTDLEVEKNMEILSELCDEEDEATLHRLLREVSGVVNPCHFCKEMKNMHPDCVVNCTGWSGMGMLKFMYFRENPMGMTHSHTHSAVIMNCNDREAYKYLMDKVFSITYIDRAMIVKNYLDNELIKYHPELAPIIWWYNALLYRYYRPYSLKKEENSTQMD